MSFLEITVLAQKALDIYRECTKSTGHDSIFVKFAISPLLEASINHYDAQRAYSYLRSHGFIISTHRPRSTRNFHLYIQPSGSVQDEIATRQRTRAKADLAKSKLDQQQVIELKIAAHLKAIEILQIELIQLNSVAFE